MPVELTITEEQVSLDTTVVEVTLSSSSTPGPAGPGVPTGGTDGQVLTKASATDYDTAWEDAGGAGSFAPIDADYLVGSANGTLSGEIVVGTSPGGELGGTWATPTVDAVHSGSSHATVQAAAEATAAAALSAHEADTTSIHGIADTSALALTANHPTNATFNDHSARHENGGADEISIAGLDGTPTDLQTHLDDTADAHDASAISFTPAGSIAATDVQAAIEEVASEAGGGGGAPADADYLVGTANGTLSGEIVVGTSPGGELGGTWASPTVDATHSGSSHAAVQAAAEATAAAALSAHLTDAADAHDASAISIADAGNDFTATDVEGALAELQSDAEADATALSDHIADATAAHAASAISVSSATLSGTGTDVQAVFEEIDNLLDDHSARHENGGADEISIAGLDGTPTELTNHLNDATDAHDASAISNVAAGNIVATDVQAAINELDTEKTTAAAALTAAQTEIADQKRAAVIAVSDPNGDAITTGDGKAYFSVPNLINGHNLVAVAAALTTVSSSGDPLIQIHNLTQTADMLSTRVSIDANELHSKDATAAAVIDTGNDDVAYGDLLRVDIDTAGTGAKGLFVILTFEAP